MEDKEKNQEAKILEIDNFNWIVPECCREGWDSCTHVVKRQKKSKNNIGL